MKRISTATRAIAVMTLVPFAIGSCGSCGSKSSDPGGGSTAPAPLAAYKLPDDAPDGLDLRVSEGQQGAPAFDRAKLAPAKPLAAAEVDKLLARAKPLVADPADFQAFALRPNSQPPPRTGETIKSSFPAPPSTLLPPSATDAHKDLTVLRYMPEGEVPLAPELSVTFSQPMIAVTSQDDASKTKPVKLTPEPKGRWRWIGTRTILFDPEVRFPMATTYTVEIPAGTKAATGQALAAPTKFTFETPAPTIVQSYPSSHAPQHLNVPMFLLFDQKIDPQAVLAKLKVTAGNKPVTVSLISQAELAAGKTKDMKELASIIEATQKTLGAVGKAPAVDGRWLAFKATSDFPADASIDVIVDEGTPSAEGPNKTKAKQSFSFRTYPPLKIERAECGYRNRECAPGQAFVVDFNNPLDTDKWDDAAIAVSPDIPGLRIIQSHDRVVVSGMTKSRVTYKVTVKGSVLDEFGQKLGKDEIHTFTVGNAHPTFYGPSGMVVLDPAAKRPTLDFFSTNYDQLRVTLYRVTHADFDAYNFYLRNRWNKDNPPAIPGTKVFDQNIATKVAPNELVETAVDLSSALTNGKGHAIAIVKPHPWPHAYEPPTMISWVQATKLGIDAYVDADTLHAFATELDTGKPASGVALEVRPFGLAATTDAKGVATIALGANTAKGAHYLVAKRGDDLAFVTDHSYYGDSGSWVKQERPPTLMWYVLDDRQMYKPGEEVSLKGWLRLYETAKHGDIKGIGDGVSLTYVVRDSRNNEIAKGTAPVSALGTFDTKFTLPKTPNLGYASVVLQAGGRVFGQHHHGFQIQEFRRPEFEVSAKASEGPFLVAGSGDVTVSAKYYTGGPLPGAPVHWSVNASQTNFTPPNRDDFVFGAWEPWWGYHHRYYDDDGRGYKPPKTWSLVGKTDAMGAHTLHLDFLTAKPAMPMSVQTTAAVSDVNRQTWVASAPLLVHPSELYVGLKTKKPFVQKGQPFEIDVIGVGIDGKQVAGAKVEVKTVRLDYEYKKGKYTTKELDPQTCNVTVAVKDPSPCSFATREGGTYQTTATITDSRGRPNTTKLTFWVTGGKQIAARDVEQERVQLIPDKKEYSAGNTAELLVQTPFFPAEGVVSWRRSGIVKTERITMTGPTAVIQVPITEALVPNMYVQVDLIGMAARLDDNGDPDPKLPKRPAYASGQINLPVPPKQRTLAVTVAPNAAKIGPGESAKLAVTVADAAGKPVPDAEVAVIVVDEAILALSGYQFGSPLDRFYQARSPDARDHYSRAYVKLAKPEVGVLAQTTTTAASGSSAGGDNDAPMADPVVAEAPAPASPAAGLAKEDAAPAKPSPKNERFGGKDQQQGQQGGEATGSIAIRSNFNPLAAWAPAVRSDAQGKATVDIKLPDNLTRYRIVAIASAGDKQFGKGESAITARLPLMVRPSPPRFLNFGDTFQLPVVVQNQTDAPMTVKLAARTTNAKLTDGAGREVTIPANDRVEVRFPAAAELAGTARFQLVGTAGDASDAAEVALPVWTPATTEAFATYGVIDDGAVKQPVALPGAVVQQFGGLEVTTASTNLQALTDAMLYLVRYPYECAEQRASRILAIAALRDVLAAFKTKDMPTPQAMSSSVDADIERLSQMQNYDGGFAFWERGYPSEPYLSVHVANALSRAKAKGYGGTDAMLARVKSYLVNIESHYPHWYGPEIRQAISAYALYTRKLMGDVDIAKAKQILAQGGGATKTAMETNGWLLGTMAGNAAAQAEREAIVRHALNKVSETAGAANFTTSYGDGAYVLLASDRRVDAVMLESLIQEQPKLDLIPKIVTGLLAHRKRGRWLNTQENSFALLAMDRYFQTYEKTTPDFVARVWLGNDYAGDHAFKGRTTDYHAVSIAMKDVAAHDKQDLTIQKDGKGRLYYRVGMTYAPASLKLDPADHGFVVERIYEGVDDPKDVVKQPDGTWKIKAGARVRIKLTMVNENRRYHVALVDPLPAGLEAMNPALAVTGPIPTDPNPSPSSSNDASTGGGHGRYWWWYGPWYEHQNLRDERTEAFASILWQGVHKYEYVARATTPGNFVVPPPKAEEMYMPETFGRGASDRVIVE